MNDCVQEIYVSYAKVNKTDGILLLVRKVSSSSSYRAAQCNIVIVTAFLRDVARHNCYGAVVQHMLCTSK